MKQSEIESMSVAERLQAMEVLWSTFDDGNIDSPEWHEEVINERKKRIESGDARFVSLDKLKQYPA